MRILMLVIALALTALAIFLPNDYFVYESVAYTLKSCIQLIALTLLWLTSLKIITCAWNSYFPLYAGLISCALLFVSAILTALAIFFLVVGNIVSPSLPFYIAVLASIIILVNLALTATAMFDFSEKPKKA